jgi:CheY-like chemotaxis protein
VELQSMASEARKILIADDEHHIRAVLAAKLRSAGHEVREARDGAEALVLAFEQRPDLVVTDLQMPSVSGLELCERLKVDERTRDVPALLITARGYIVRDDQLAATNIRAMLSKPFSAREVLKQVEAILSGGAAGSGRVAA